MSRQKYWIVISSALCFLGVAFGAFGAHILKSRLAPEMFETFQTGIFYHLLHSVVMLSIGFYGASEFLRSQWFFLAGIILFSFTLYAYSITSVKFFAMVTPVGGIFLLTGWTVLLISALKKN